MAKLVLELNLEPEVIKNAEVFARKKHTDLNTLVDDFIKAISVKALADNNIVAEEQVPYVIEKKTKSEEKAVTDPFLEKLRIIKITDEIMALSGILKVDIPEDADLKELMREAKYEYLKEKYRL